MMKLSAIIKELGLLLCFILAGWLLGFWATGSPKLSRTLDINFHDTYFVISGLILVALLLTPPVTIFYLIRAAILRFKQTLPNLAALLMLLLLTILLSGLIKAATGIESHLQGDWTIYPPLSALPKPTAKPSAIHISSILFGIQIFFLLILAIVAVFTGRNWKLKQ